MKKKFLTFLLAICFMIPFAFLLTACGDNPPDEPSLNSYTLYIKDVETYEYRCVYGEKAIQPEDVVVKANWSDDTQTTVPLSDFDISVLWYNENSEEQTTMPNFWTNGTGDTYQDLATNYSFKLSQDGYILFFSVNISKANNSSLSVLINYNNESSDIAEMEWAHNRRNPNDIYSLEVSGLEEGYDEYINWYPISKSEYLTFSTTEELKEYLIEQRGAYSEHNLFNNLTPDTYYIFAKVSESDNYNYGEEEDGWVSDYATLTITKADIMQTAQNNEIDYQSDWESDIELYQLTEFLDNEITNIEGTKNYLAYYYENGEWTTKDFSGEIKVHAIKDELGYTLVDLVDWESGTNEWFTINEDGSNALPVTDTSKIELVSYSKLRHYINSSKITIPVYYMIDAERMGGHYDFTEVFKTKVKINKYILDIGMPIVEKGTPLNYGEVIEDDYFKFTYTTSTSITQSPSAVMEQAYRAVNRDAYNKIYTLTKHTEKECTQYYHVAEVVLLNPNFAWNLGYSLPHYVRYNFDKLEIDLPVYTKNEVDYNEYFTDAIEVTWDENDWYQKNYKIKDHIAINMDWVDAYKYKMTEEDFELTRSDLIEKIKAQGVKVQGNEDITTETNNTPGTFIVMFELKNKTSTVWIDDTIDEKLFKFEIVKAEQNPRIVDEYDFEIEENQELYICVNPDGTADLSTIIFDKEYLENNQYYEGSNEPIVFELVDAIPETEYTTTGVGTFEDDIITITVNEDTETNPLGIFCFKITKAGNEFYNDFVMYVRVEVVPYYYIETDDYIEEIRGLDNYVEASDNYEYSGVVFTEGQKIGEVLPELPTTGYGRYVWAIRYSENNYEYLTYDSVLESSEPYVELLFIANEGMEWFIDEQYDGVYDGFAQTGKSLSFYVEQAN